MKRKDAQEKIKWRCCCRLLFYSDDGHVLKTKWELVVHEIFLYIKLNCAPAAVGDVLQCLLYARLDLVKVRVKFWMRGRVD